MPKCENENCEKEATHSITLNVPAKGIAIDLHTPIKMYVGVQLCHEHAKEFGSDFTWDDNYELREAIEATIAAAGLSEPDFNKTFHSVVSMNHDGYQQFLKIRGQRSQS